MEEVFRTKLYPKEREAFVVHARACKALDALWKTASRIPWWPKWKKS
jgi:hypothetical protein